MKKIIIAFMFTLTLSACSAVSNSQPSADTTNPATGTAPASIAPSTASANLTKPAPTQLPLTMREIIKHQKADNCWLVIDGKVYDVTKFIASHPGGANRIVPNCGQDATTLFETRPMGSGTPHSPKARDLLSKYYLGDLQL
ncbi:MAG TPA: cytochrome B5 [Candidatus Jacksonbacteria bacterium]|nr:cytochrome B5 [Candidatus Jacksonbacteria bacterium]